MVTTTVRIPVQLSEDIREIAKREGRSQSEVIHHLLRYGVQEDQAEQTRGRK